MTGHTRAREKAAMTFEEVVDQALAMLQRRDVGKQVAEATRSYLTSLPGDATQFAKAVREH
jgi:hypothetical protein